MAFSSTRVFFKFIFTEEKGHVIQSQITTKKPTGDQEIGIPTAPRIKANDVWIILHFTSCNTLVSDN